MVLEGIEQRFSQPFFLRLEFLSQVPNTTTAELSPTEPSAFLVTTALQLTQIPREVPADTYQHSSSSLLIGDRLKRDIAHRHADVVRSTRSLRTRIPSSNTLYILTRWPNGL